jgi:hypothetical protein
MIIRILGEGQFITADEIRAQLDLLDHRLTRALDEGDELELRGTLTAMQALIRTAGEPLPPDALTPSDVIVPGDDATHASIRALLDVDVQQRSGVR